MIYDYYAINGSQDNSLTLSDQLNSNTRNPNMKQSKLRSAKNQTLQRVNAITDHRFEVNHSNQCSPPSVKRTSKCRRFCYGCTNCCNMLSNSFQHTLFFLFFFFKVFGGHTCNFFRATGFLVTSPLVFKARVGSALFTFCRGECNVHSLRSTSGVTLADLLVAGKQPVLSPHTVAEVRLPGFKLVLSEYL